MQIEWKVDSVARAVTLTVSGNLGDEELLGLADEFAKASEVDRDFSLLIDLRQAHGQKVTSAGVRKLVARPLVLSAAFRLAVVVPSNLGFGMARMYEMLREGEGRGGAMRVFHDYDEAQRWITISVR
jgi:hypothetical protein